MFIVKKISLFISFLLLIQSCSDFATNQDHVENTDACEQTRGAIDIGSGSTKLIVAIVDTCKLKIKNIIFEAQRAIALKEDLSRNKENFSDEMIKKLISNLNELDFLAKEQGATKIASLATSAFRTANNSKAVVLEIEKNVDFKINVITQKEEAMHAYLAAKESVSLLKLDQTKPIAVWDIGGGSMQIIKEMKGSDPDIFMGQTASVTFKNLYLDKISRSKKKSPNPLLKNGAITAMNLARKVSNTDTLSKIKSLNGYEVIGVGGVHFHSIKKQVGLLDNIYNQEVLLNTLLERAKLNDAQIGGDYAQTDVTNLALVLGFMQSLQVEKVHTLNINMANGLLLDQSLWN